MAAIERDLPGSRWLVNDQPPLLGVLRVEPGDIVVFRWSEHVSTARHMRTHNQLEKTFAGRGATVLLLPYELTLATNIHDTDPLLRALVQAGHTGDCAIGMAWRGEECHCPVDNPVDGGDNSVMSELIGALEADIEDRLLHGDGEDRFEERHPESSPHPRCERPNCEEHEFPGLYGCMGCAALRTADDLAERAERLDRLNPDNMHGAGDGFPGSDY